ncbi:uncharacterized protein LOC120425286 isoform X2 [Culex pipiens pallens]|uniref:uncharacterized protein LOC120425286 isoform X2 n=1 Tax=Culex pipiens pallens TaxID=42434 RepID=UPI0022AB3948|nr:uncharacterized protein LOC120425286 isoform X2 [Culex pipiens pallens]
MDFLAELAVLVTIWHTACGQCTVNINTALQSPEPVFFRNNLLWAPAGPSLVWSAGETTAISCQSGTLSGFTVSSTSITCRSGTSFTVGGTVLDSSALTCSTRVTGEVEVTSTACGGGSGQLRNIGFRNSSGQMVTYIQSCYNFNTASVFYTRHVIPGRAIKYAISEAYRPAFKVTGTASTVSPATSYTTAQQSSRLATLLGSQAQADKYITSSSFMSRGHLSPDADGIFRPWQWATYYYVNVAPQWQAVNAGNWLRVEDAVRAVSNRLQEDVLIFTGNQGIMTLPNVSGQQIPITLEAGGIQAPKWYWKIVKSPSTNAGIALVTNNDPFRTSMPATEMLCSNVCATYGWANANYANFAQGYTYCCTVAALMKAIPAIPVEASVANVLAF